MWTNATTVRAQQTNRKGTLLRGPIWAKLHDGYEALRSGSKSEAFALHSVVTDMPTEAVKQSLMQRQLAGLDVPGAARADLRPHAVTASGRMLSEVTSGRLSG